MKRKHEDADAPSKKSKMEVEYPTYASSTSFDKLGLDPRLLQAIQKQKFTTPTPIQSRAIPLAFEGKDVLARARTGSGKTAAYVLPILHSILQRKAANATLKSTSALILVPTNELAGQVTKAIGALASSCAREIRTENLARKEDDKVTRARIASSPDMIVATPYKTASYINSGVLDVSELTHLVVDEADLVLSYCSSKDLDTIRKVLPENVQSTLMSATLGKETDTLKEMFCRDAVVLQLDAEEKDSSAIKQYIVKCGEEEKFLLLYAIFMLKLITGKTLIFVGDIDRSYRVKLFLEQFGIRSCVLNSELPVNSRIHVVEEFNKGVYDIIIASDEHEVIDSMKRRKKEEDAEEEEEEGAEPGNKDGDANGEAEDGGQKILKIDQTEVDEGTGTDGNEEDEAKSETEDQAKSETEDQPIEPAPRPKKKAKKDRRDKEYGVARGIDFKNVACVLNFDLPLSSRSYTHRVGRTARAGKTGTALSFVIPKAEYRKHKPTSMPSTALDEEVLAKIERRAGKRGEKLEPYAFDMKKLEGFRYRLADALRSVTAGAIREARLRELRQELIRSERLKRHFEENPEDLRHLRHDGELRAARVQQHLKHVPDYLLPGGSRESAAKDVGFVGMRKQTENRVRRARETKARFGKGKKSGSREKKGKVNPLASFGKGRK